MAEIKNRAKMNPQYTTFKKILFSISWYPIFILPSVLLLRMALRLRPVKRDWVVYSLLTFAVTIISAILGNTEEEMLFLFTFLTPILLVVYVWKARVYEEYVTRYNALVDAGYFYQQSKNKAEELRRRDEEIVIAAKREAEKLTRGEK